MLQWNQVWNIRETEPLKVAVTASFFCEPSIERIHRNVKTIDSIRNATEKGALPLKAENCSETVNNLLTNKPKGELFFIAKENNKVLVIHASLCKCFTTPDVCNLF